MTILSSSSGGPTVYSLLPENLSALSVPVLYILLAAASTGWAQDAHAPDNPYFVTYSHDMTEPGTLELETKTAAARPHGGSPYGALAEEMEYGVTSWWTANSTSTDRPPMTSEKHND